MLSWQAQSQELPPILNFGPVDYAAGNQNWMISKSESGNIYVANSMGLLEFNGSRWELYSVPNKTVVRAVRAVGDSIFTGAYMEAGFWKKNMCGYLEYHSLLSKFPGKINDGEQFWRIENIGQIVIFQSFEGIYLYHIAEDKITRVNTPAGLPISSLYKAGAKIYFFVPEMGLYSVQNGGAEIVISEEILGDKEIVFLTDANKGLRLIDRKGEQFLWSRGELTNLNLSLTEEIAGVSIFSAVELPDGSLLLGSVENGIYQVSTQGRLIRHFNQENGLQNNTVLSLYLDEEKNVWAGLDNGVSILNLNSPFRLYQDHVGKIGTVYTSFQTQDFLYLGTNQGLYYRRNGEKNFKFIPDTNGQVWSLEQIDGTLFCGHNDGTYVVNGGTAEKISEKQGTWTIIRYQPEENVYVQGHYNGFSFLKREGEDFVDLPMVKDFPHSSKSIVSEKDGDIWIGNEHRGVFRLQVDSTLSNIEETRNYTFGDGSGITSSIFNFNNHLFYSSIDNIFQYDPSSDSFTSNNTLEETFAEVELISGKMIAMEDMILAFGTNAVVGASISGLERGYSLKSVFLPRQYRSIPWGYENVTRIQNNNYLLGLVDGYILFNDLFEEPKRNYNLRIDRVTKASLDGPPIAVALSGSKDLEYKYNNLNLYFSIPEYKKYVVPLYSYRLKGFSEKWSDWTPDSRAAFKNLPYGDYQFQVRGRVGDEMISVATFALGVARPWYLSNIAIAGYVLLFLLFLLLIHLVYKKEHEKRIRENEKALKMKNLEAEQKIIKLQNEQLEREMAGKSKELAASTMSLIKKNEFLTSIKEKLKESEGSSQVKSVIRTIDKDISEEDNWNFFKTAFSNADKDFFKKIKAKHPDLTSNDLKLCAYLRLNLSSKEIAPLLNISVKSVEIKRYRLRKKMELPREINLVDYILEI